MAELITNLIKTVTYLVVIVIWVFLGLYVAIPAITFSSLLLPLGILSAIFGGSGAKAMSNWLEEAIAIYPDGFRTIHGAIWDESRSESGNFWEGIFCGVIALVLATIGWGIILWSIGRLL